MNLHFKTVVNYVKNLFPGCAPVARSKTAVMDAKVLSQLSLDNFYIEARNGKTYWYCCVRDAANMPVARYIIRSNGFRVRKHRSEFTYGWVLRVKRDCIAKNPSGKEFVRIVMDKDTVKLDDRMYESHLRTIRQRMK